jgi:hypothetical protein
MELFDLSNDGDDSDSKGKDGKRQREKQERGQMWREGQRDTPIDGGGRPF